MKLFQNCFFDPVACKAASIPRSKTRVVEKFHCHWLTSHLSPVKQTMCSREELVLKVLLPCKLKIVTTPPQKTWK